MDQQQQSRWRPTRGQLQWAGAAVAVLTIAILIGYPFGITLWDWMKLLFVPVVIAAGGLWFNQQQQDRQMAIQDQHAQDAALQAYLDQLTQLLVTEKDHELIKMRVEDDVRQVIQARSEPLLRSVDSTRRWSLILFLSVMGLLARDRPLVSLARADLRGVDGRGAPLEGIDLASADLSGAHLSGAVLSGADLRRADLAKADLRGANLRGAVLEGANLKGAHMDPLSISVSPTRPLMKGPAVLLQDASLRDANLEGANLLDAQLEGADLSGAHMSGADLRGADLRRADLTEVDLFEANLSGANLSEARGWTEAQLSEARTLVGATMPNGQILKSDYNPDGPTFEEWLKEHKDRERRGEDVENE